MIVAGFQGVAQDTKDVTTLGRGASDTTAVALAASLGADYCEIYSDVDGVFTADPRIVASARQIPDISYEEMLEMAACGAKILHLRCVEYARRENVRVHVRSSFSDKPGTWIQDQEEGGPDGTGHHLRRRARPQRSQDHHRRRAGPGRRRGPDLRGDRPHRDQHRHDRAERVRGGDGPHRHLVHPAQDRRCGRDRHPGSDPPGGGLRRGAVRRPDRQGVRRRRRHAIPSRA